MRYVEYPLWINQTVNAGEFTVEVDTSKFNRFQVYVSVTSATQVIMFYNIYDRWVERDRMTFTGTGGDWWVVWADIPKKVKFELTQTTTITLILYAQA
jgi:hypothetical protein